MRSPFLLERHFLVVHGFFNLISEANQVVIMRNLNPEPRYNEQNRENNQMQNMAQERVDSLVSTYEAKSYEEEVAAQVKRKSVSNASTADVNFGGAADGLVNFLSQVMTLLLKFCLGTL